MAHYAKIVDGIVETVIVAEADHIATLEGVWVKTSYNMSGGVYYTPNTTTPASDQSIIKGDEARERKNFAGVGHSYNGTGFYAPKPFDSWIFNPVTYLWEPPVAQPNDDKFYSWNESTGSWDEVGS